MSKYKCSSCGSVKSVSAGSEAPTCCDKAMKEAREKEGSSGCGCCG